MASVSLSIFTILFFLQGLGDLVGIKKYINLNLQGFKNLAG